MISVALIEDNRLVREGMAALLNQTADVRVVAATHQDLDGRVLAGLFREDLLHRLNVIRIHLPPLRARREDIPELVRHYLVVAARELGVEPKLLSPAAERLLVAADWPGNVRQVVNVCRRLTVAARGSEIRPEDVPAELGGSVRGEGQDDWARALEQWARGRAEQGGEPLLDAALPEFERTLIRVALARSEGRRQDAARVLGWGRNTLTRKMRELGLERGTDATDTAA